VAVNAGKAMKQILGFLLVLNKIMGGEKKTNPHSEFKEIAVLSLCNALTKCIFTVSNTSVLFEVNLQWCILQVIYRT